MDIDLISANVVDLSLTGVEVICVLKKHLSRNDNRRQYCFEGYVARCCPIGNSIRHVFLFIYSKPLGPACSSSMLDGEKVPTLSPHRVAPHLFNFFGTVIMVGGGPAGPPPSARRTSTRRVGRRIGGSRWAMRDGF